MNNYKITSIISIYKNENCDHYLEISDVIEEKNLANTKPLSPDTLSSIALLNKNIEHKTSSLLPSDIIYLSFNMKLLIIAKRDTVRAGFELKDRCKGKLQYPPMIFILKGDKLQVYCYKKYEKEKTKLYYNCFTNNLGDSICLGNIKIESTDYIEKIHKYIDTYYNSIFAEHGKINMRCKEGQEINMYKKAIKGKIVLEDYLLPLMKDDKQMIVNDIIS